MFRKTNQAKSIIALKTLFTMLLAAIILADASVIIELARSGSGVSAEELLLPVYVAVPLIILVAITLLGVFRDRKWAYILLLVFLCVALPLSMIAGYIGYMLLPLLADSPGSNGTSAVTLICFAAMPVLTLACIGTLLGARKTIFGTGL